MQLTSAPFHRRMSTGTGQSRLCSRRLGRYRVPNWVRAARCGCLRLHFATAWLFMPLPHIISRPCRCIACINFTTIIYAAQGSLTIDSQSLTAVLTRCLLVNFGYALVRTKVGTTRARQAMYISSLRSAEHCVLTSPWP